MSDMIEKSSLDNSFEKRAREKDDRPEDKNSSLSEGSKENDDKKLAPVVKRSDVKVEKEGIFTKIRKSFISEDMSDILFYAWDEIIVPGIKDGFLSTLEHMFYRGDSSYRRSYSSGSSRSRERTNYSSYYRSSIRDEDDRDRRRRRDRDFDDRKEEKVDYRRIILKNEKDARKIVDTLRDYIHDYNEVSVARLLDLIDEPGKYTDNNYGWKDERDINYRRVRNGYLIDVPEAEYLGD